MGSALDENHVNFFMSKRMQALLSLEPLVIFLCGYPIITTVLRDHLLTRGIKVSAHSRYRKKPDASNKTTFSVTTFVAAEAITTNVLSNLIGLLPKERKMPSQWERKGQLP
jgi:hypothetical protein